MKEFRYLSGVSTLILHAERCVGCGSCALVCPHQVFAVPEKKARIIDLDGCMDCGACSLNCPVAAIEVRPGVGCASYIIQTWLKGKDAVIECC